MFALKYASHDPMAPEYISVIFNNYIELKYILVFLF